MARIRIVDEWLRSPVSPPSRHRAILVVASSWAEQRVLMRAFAGSADQTRPTIVLHGSELAIGPASVDAHGEWGIHVEPPADGRAQELKGQLEVAAKRLAGSKGNPPRLMDEESSFDRKVTSHWSPNMRRTNPSSSMAVPSTADAGDRPVHYEPALVAPPVGSVTNAKPVAGAPPTLVVPPSESRGMPMSVPAAAQAANKGGGISSTPAPQVQRTVLAASAARRAPEVHPGSVTPVPGSRPSFRRTRLPDRKKSAAIRAERERASERAGKTTRLGFASQAAPVTSPTTSAGSGGGKRLASLVTHTMPLGFQLTEQERKVLNELGAADSLRASDVANIAGVGDGVVWMEALMSKLSNHGLDLVVPGDDIGGEPTYELRR